MKPFREMFTLATNTKKSTRRLSHAKDLPIGAVDAAYDRFLQELTGDGLATGPIRSTNEAD